MTTTDAINTAQPSSLGRRASPSTTIPRIDPTTGSATVIVGSDADSEPARNDDCCQAVPATATAAQTYNSGVPSTAHKPCPRRSTTPLVSTANTPHSDPETKPSRTAAAGRPANTRAPTTHSTSAGPMIAITPVQTSNAARE